MMIIDQIHLNVVLTILGHLSYHNYNFLCFDHKLTISHSSELSGETSISFSINSVQHEQVSSANR